MAAILTDVLGRRIIYSDPSPVRFAWRMRQRGETWGYIGVMSAIYMTTRLGMAATVYPQLAELLRRRPLTFYQFAADEARTWQK